MVEAFMVLQRWRELVLQCEKLAESYEADPTAAALQGLEPDFGGEAIDAFAVYGGIGERQPRNMHAAWLRTACRETINEHIWRYSIVEALGGRVYVALHSFVGEDADLERDRETDTGQAAAEDRRCPACGAESPNECRRTTPVPPDECLLRVSFS